MFLPGHRFEELDSCNRSRCERRRSIESDFLAVASDRSRPSKSTKTSHTRLFSGWRHDGCQGSSNLVYVRKLRSVNACWMMTFFERWTSLFTSNLRSLHCLEVWACWHLKSGPAGRLQANDKGAQRCEDCTRVPSAMSKIGPG